MNRWMTSAGALALLAGVGVAEAAPRLESAIVPSVRSVQAGGTATAFGALTNSGDVALTNCRPQLEAGLPNLTFSYQTTNASNQLTGAPNTPANIAVGATQNFVFSIAVGAGQTPDTLGPSIVFSCGATEAPQVEGVNTFTLSVGPNAPDIIPIVVSASPGIADVTTLGGTAAIAAAAINIGAAGNITVIPSASLGVLSPFVESFICETNAQGACLSAPAPFVNTAFANNQTKTFTSFFKQAGPDATLTGTPFYPDVVRAGLLFGTTPVGDPMCAADGTLRGLATVAYRSPDPGRGAQLIDGTYQFVFDDVATRGRSFGIGYYFSAIQRFYITQIGEAFLTPGSFLPISTGVIDAILSSGPNPSLFADARVVLQSFSLQGAATLNHSMVMGDQASSRFKFQGRGTAGTGASPLPAAMDNDFRSLWLPLAEGAVVKADYPGAYTPLQGSNPGLTMTLQAGGAGQPMNFTGSFNGTCTVTGALRPVTDTTTPYMAEMTVAGTNCPTVFPAGTYDGYAQLTAPVPAQTLCGIPFNAVPRQITFQFSPLARGARSAIPPGTFAGMLPLIVQR